MKRFAVAVLAVTSIAGAAFAGPSARDVCFNIAYLNDVPAVIAACTSMLETKGMTAQDRAKTFAHRGLAYDSHDDYDLAIADYSRAIELDPKNKLAFKGRGFDYSFKGKNGMAIADLSRAIALDPEDWNAISHRGSAYLSAGRYKQAVADYDRAVALNPNDAQAFYERGLAKEHLGDKAGASADKAKALALDPKIGDELAE